MNLPHSVLAKPTHDRTPEPFEWTERPGENLISDSDWVAVKKYGRLSMREGQVCQLLFEGHKRDVIAEMLKISPRTVRYHLESLHKKLQVNTRVGLVLRIVQLRDFVTKKNSFSTNPARAQFVSQPQRQEF